MEGETITVRGTNFESSSLRSHMTIFCAERCLGKIRLWRTGAYQRGEPVDFAYLRISLAFVHLWILLNLHTSQACALVGTVYGRSVQEYAIRFCGQPYKKTGERYVEDVVA